jgi:hypothetical protein
MVTRDRTPAGDLPSKTPDALSAPFASVTLKDATGIAFVAGLLASEKSPTKNIPGLFCTNRHLIEPVPEKFTLSRHVEKV